jgi:7-cyano-7-deazaguanine synthase
MWCQLHGVGTLAIGCLGNNPFADATEEFFAAFGNLLDTATGSKVELIRALADLSKSEVMRRGQGLPLEKTFSCIRPENGLHCGQCNKCAERRAALRFFESGDPTQYATNEAAAVAE